MEDHDAAVQIWRDENERNNSNRHSILWITKMRLLSDYELVSISPGAMKAKVDLTIRIFPVPPRLREQREVSVQVTVVVTTDTDNPKSGEVCAPDKYAFMRH